METFTMWLNQELQKRDWLAADLARKAKLGKSTITRILSGNREAGPEVCTAIADALGEPPEKVFRLAGLLPPLPPEDASLRGLIEYAHRLTREQRELVLRFAQFTQSDAPPPPLPAPPPEPLPAEPENTPDFEDIMDLAQHLDEVEMQNAYEYIRWRLEEQRRRRDSSGRRPGRTREELLQQWPRDRQPTDEELIELLNSVSETERQNLDKFLLELARRGLLLSETVPTGAPKPVGANGEVTSGGSGK